MNEELIIEILRYGLENGALAKPKRELLDQLIKKGFNVQDLYICQFIDNCIEDYYIQFFHAGSDVYRFKPQSYVYLLQYDQLQKSRELARSTQEQTIAVQTQARLAEEQAISATKSAAQSNKIAYLALILTIVFSAITIWYSQKQVK